MCTQFKDTMYNIHLYSTSTRCGNINHWLDLCCRDTAYRCHRQRADHHADMWLRQKWSGKHETPEFGTADVK